MNLNTLDNSMHAMFDNGNILLTAIIPGGTEIKVWETIIPPTTIYKSRTLQERFVHLNLYSQPNFLHTVYYE